MTEYIRKRRLSKAAEELRKTKNKIIDIAIKYQYDSPVSFSNAFKKMYGQSPANFRKSSTEIIFFPKIEFNPSIKGMRGLKYRIVEMEEQTFYGKTTGVIANIDKKAIQELYTKCREDKTLNFIAENSNRKELYYGIYEDVYENDNYGRGKYYLLGKTPREDFVKIKLPKSKWACFKLPNKKQKEISKLYNTIYMNWLPASEYKIIEKYPQLEIYYENYCEICIAVQ